MLLPIYDLAAARQTILKRVPLDTYTVSPGLQAGIEQLFGEPLTPEAVVQRILSDVRSRGDAALRHWSAEIDGTTLDAIAVPQAAVRAAYDALDDDLIDAMRLSAERVRRFHEQQPITSWITTQLGGTLGQIVQPIQRVGVYAPAGTAPLPSSILMSAIPARVAGVSEVVVACPPARETGEVSPIMLVAADLAGVDAVYALGGAQAVGALAYGTESVPAVDKIVGPGNIFVVLAKRAVYGVVGIDGMPGPTETMVIADGSANAEWAAADLLAQAEHDLLASAILVTPNRDLAERVQAAVEQQVAVLSRADVIRESLTHRGGIVITETLTEAIDVANDYAAEHLCLLVDNAWDWVSQITNAGGIFVGEHSFEVLGDYIAGPSHVMPTGGTARFSSPLNVLDFMKITSLVSLSQADGKHLSAHAARFARAESLTAHANAAQQRADAP